MRVAALAVVAVVLVGGVGTIACGAAYSADAGPASDAGGDSSDAGTAADAPFDPAADGASAAPVPVVLKTGEGVVRHLAVRGDAIYWGAEDGTIRTCRVDTCSATVRTIASAYKGATAPAAIAVDDTHVYWTAFLNSLVFRAPVGPVNGAPAERFAAFDAFSGPKPTGLVLDDIAVYFGSQSPDEIRSCPRSGPCADAGSVLATSPLGFTRALAANASSLFWLAGDFGSNAGGVFTSPKSGGTTVPVAYDVPGPRGIAVRDNAVFVTSWAEPPAGTPAPPGAIYRIVGTLRSALATNETNPTSIAVDDKNVYWANQGDGTIRRCAVSGCGEKPTTIATQQGVPESVVTDETSLYWADSLTGAIVRLKKN